MEPFKLRFKVGPHEFEAEGDQETVERQLAVWRELIASPSVQVPASPPPPPPQFGGLENPLFVPPAPPADSGADERREYSKIFKHEGRVVSLTVQPQTESRAADALLVLLLGQSVFNGPEPVTGQQLSDGMRQSGIPIERVDRGWGPHLAANVLPSGVKRSRRYRLSNTGLARAREIAKELLALVP